MAQVVEPMPGSEADVRLRIGLVLLPNFTLLTFAGFLDVLRLAADEGDRSRQSLCRWTIMAPDRAPVRSSCGAMVSADADLLDPGQFDYVAVFGGLLHDGLPVDGRIDAFLRRAALRKVPLIGLCTAVFTLIRLGLMSGRRCCVSWFHYDELVEAFPEVTPIADQLFVLDGPRITCAGGVGAVDLAAWLVKRHLGEATADKALHILIADGARPAHAPQPHVLADSRARDPRVRRVLRLMEQSLAMPPTVEELASCVGLSRRQLERIFRHELGVSPAEYGRRIRLKQGHWLLVHTPRSVTDIAYACGFADAAHFSRSLKAVFGRTPRDVRSGTGDAPDRPVAGTMRLAGA